MKACLCDIRSWVINDKLMINDSKTEFMLIGTKAQLQKTKSATLTIDEYIISPSTEPLRNLGAWFDCHFNLNFNITKTCRSAFFHLHNIRRVRKYLSMESAEKLVHAFITSRLDYCNSLLYGLPHCALTKLQRVQNAAARVLYLAPRFCHITKILLLPFQSHNNWQILCFLHLIERSLELILHGTVCFSVFYRIKTDFRKIENEVTTKMSWLCL